MASLGTTDPRSDLRGGRRRLTDTSSYPTNGGALVHEQAPSVGVFKTKLKSVKHYVCVCLTTPAIHTLHAQDDPGGPHPPLFSLLIRVAKLQINREMSIVLQFMLNPTVLRCLICCLCHFSHALEAVFKKLAFANLIVLNFLLFAINT